MKNNTILKPRVTTKLIVATVFFLLLFMSPLLSAIDHKAIQSVNQRLDWLFGEHKSYHLFFEEFKKTIMNQNCSKLAEMAYYPLLITSTHAWTHIYDPSTFISECDSIITPELYKAVKAQHYDNLFANWQGIMIGKGNVWLSRRCMKEKSHYQCKKWSIKLVTINQNL